MEEREKLAQPRRLEEGAGRVYLGFGGHETELAVVPWALARATVVCAFRLSGIMMPAAGLQLGLRPTTASHDGPAQGSAPALGSGAGRLAELLHA